MNFKDYYETNKRPNLYRFKACIDFSENLEDILKFLKKYYISGRTEVDKFMFDKSPVDFPKVQNSEVWYFDFELGSNISADLLRSELAGQFGFPLDYVVVRYGNDPLELISIQSQADQEMADKASNLEFIAKLENGGNYTPSEYTDDGDLFYGDKFNKTIISYMTDEQKENESTNNDLLADVPVIDLSKATKQISKYGNFTDVKTEDKEDFEYNEKIKTVKVKTNYVK